MPATLKKPKPAPRAAGGPGARDGERRPPRFDRTPSGGAEGEKKVGGPGAGFQPRFVCPLLLLSHDHYSYPRPFKPLLSSVLYFLLQSPYILKIEISPFCPRTQQGSNSLSHREREDPEAMAVDAQTGDRDHHTKERDQEVSNAPRTAQMREEVVELLRATAPLSVVEDHKRICGGECNKIQKDEYFSFFIA